tara:strand:- start:10643 stop:11431 length:789 start_codon:yes stop_codon:yes gene_type:complete
LKNRIDQKLLEIKNNNKAALAPFLTVGFPSIEISEKLIINISNSGGDIIELGVPFSDPLADGVTIQKTNFRALENGVNLSTCLDMVTRLRNSGLKTPLVFMGYFNPFLNYGIEKFVTDASNADIDGVIIPDLPLEESKYLKNALEAKNIYLINLLSPTSSDARIKDVCKNAKGFIYCVSLTGVTGARSKSSKNLPQLIEKIRNHTNLPILVGFGISKKEHIDQIYKYADGVIIGSALLNAIGDSESEEAIINAKSFLKTLIN